MRKFSNAPAGLLHPEFTVKKSIYLFQINIAIPIVFVLIAIYLVIAPIVEDPQIQFLYAAVFVVSGLIFYFPLVHFKLLSIGRLI